MAYAAVISLKHTLQRLTIPSINPQITKSAYDALQSLGNILRKLDGSSNSSIDRSAIDALDAEIREAVWKVEDLIESHVFYDSQLLDEKSVEQEMDLFLETVKELKYKYKTELDKPLPAEEDDSVSALHGLGGNKSTTVGLSDQFQKITDEVLNWESGLETVSLVGMAGIGKTHLAREIYQHPLIVQHFDLTFWVNIGPKYKKDDIFVDLVAQIKHKLRDVYVGENFVTLITILKESLLDRRYLIVLDDNWSTKVCDTLLFWLPPNENGRRILVTRQEEVAKYHKTSFHHIRFLNNEESWNLLWMNVFGEEICPPQLEKVGRKIAENCEGLPLLILAVADILCGLEMTEEYWKKVADKKTSTFTDAYDRILEVLYSSYEYLPQHLKACFLYMGVFPQSCEILLSKLINLWSVEDFLEPKQFQTLEDFSMECAEELISKSLAIVCQHNANDRIKSFKLHSAYWHLCVKEARKTKFSHVLKKLTDVSSDHIERQRRLSVQNNVLFGIEEVYDSMEAASTVRSIVCSGEDHEFPVRICLDLMLLKVLDALSLRFYDFPAEVVKLLQLRYLALTHNGKLPSSISNLQQLQCLILRQHHNIKVVRGRKCLPEEIWDMQELRHLRIIGSSLPDPSHGAELPKLLTLYVNADSCTKAVFRSTPHLKKLGIRIELHPDAAETSSCFDHIELLHGLESLKCVVVNPGPRSQVVPPPHHLSNLPMSLKKLSLNGLGYSWEYMKAIGSLRMLQVLKLRCSAFQGRRAWYTGIEEFQRLEFLLLEDIDLVHWIIEGNFDYRVSFDDHNCFVNLQRMIIRHCYKLKGLPSRIRGINTLKTIEVVDCSPSIVASAQNIKKYGINSSLQLVIDSSWNLR